MAIDNAKYGGFIVSNNVLEGKEIRYTFREESTIKELNGWNIYSVAADDDYVSDPDNFTVLGAISISNIAPVLLEIFDAPYGTDLCWLYKDGEHSGFHDIIADRETTIEEILK